MGYHSPMVAYLSTQSPICSVVVVPCSYGSEGKLTLDWIPRWMDGVRWTVERLTRALLLDFTPPSIPRYDTRGKPCQVVFVSEHKRASVQLTVRVPRVHSSYSHTQTDPFFFLFVCLFACGTLNSHTPYAFLF